MARWLVSAVVSSGVLAAASCGGESVLGSGGFGGGLIGSGGSGGTGGSGPMVSAGGSSGASSMGGAGGSGAIGTCDNGMGGCGSIDAAGCDVQVALRQSCARSGCHSSLDRYGSLDLSDLSAVAAQMVDQWAPHSDITCSEPGMPFRACTPDELPQYCPGPTAGVKLIDSANPNESWVLRKLNGTQGMCGDAMPMAPGNSPTNGWNDERRVCLERFFRILALERRGPGVSVSYVPLCDLKPSLKQNCARSGCHSTIDRYAGLDWTDPNLAAAQLVDKVATHDDIGCNAIGTPFRPCTPDELIAKGCPPNALLIDSENPEESWVLKKLRGQQGPCGDQMPMAPGNAIPNGWNAERLACYEDWIYEMARFAREQSNGQ
jgi:hypothetical protein